MCIHTPPVQAHSQCMHTLIHMHSIARTELVCTHTAGVCTHAHAFHCKHTAGVHTRMHMCKHTAGACPPHCPLHPLPAGLARCPPYPPSMPPVLPMPPTSPRSGPAEPFVFLPGCPLSLGLTAGERGQVFPPTLGGRQVLPQHRAGERERRTPSLPPFPPPSPCLHWVGGRSGISGCRDS